MGCEGDGYWEIPFYSLYQEPIANLNLIRRIQLNLAHYIMHFDYACRVISSYYIACPVVLTSDLEGVKVVG